MIVHHVVEGPDDAPVLVLSPSLGSNLTMWDKQAPLTEAFRVVRYDPRGHGRSAMPDGDCEIADLGRDALNLLDHLGLERVHWCGLSIGGMTGSMWLGVHAPERIDRLVLCCTSAQLGPPEMWDERIEGVRAGGARAMAEAGVKRWLTDGHRAEHPEDVTFFEEMIAGTSDAGYMALSGAIRDMNQLDDLHRITAPTLVIAGAQDPSTPPEHAERIAARIDGARLEVLDPAAHIAAWERPDAVNRLIKEHLA